VSEDTLQWIQFLKLIWLAVFSILYGFGGVRGKWKRRFIAPVVLTLGIVGASLWTQSFNVWYLLYMPLLAASFSIGYGADKTSEKIIKRGRAGLAYAVAALPIFIPNAAWMLLGAHVVLCVGLSITLGVWNPLKSARAEETALAGIIGFLPIMYV